MSAPTRPAPAPQDVPPAPPPLPTPTYHRRHRGLRVAGAAVVGLLVGAGAVATVPEMVRDADEQVITVPPDTVRLDLRGDVGDVDVRAAAGGEEARVTASKHWSFREPVARVTSQDGALSVSLDCPRVPSVLGRCDADWEVVVPAGTDVVVRAGVGDVEVIGLTGEVAVHGSVGDVLVSGAPSSLDVATSVGEVDVVLDEPAESVRVRTSVGDVALRLPEGVTYDVRAASSLEPATVEVDSSSTSPYEVEVSTGVGSVLVGHG